MLTVQAKIVCRDEELQAQLDRNLQIGRVWIVLVLVPELEVLNDLFQDHATGGWKEG